LNVMFDSCPVLLSTKPEVTSGTHDQVVSKDGGDTSAPTAISQRRRRDDLAIFDERESSGPLSGLMTSSNTLKIGNDLRMSGYVTVQSRPASNTGTLNYFRRSHQMKPQRPQTAKMHIENKAQGIKSVEGRPTSAIPQKRTSIKDRPTSGIVHKRNSIPMYQT